MESKKIYGIDYTGLSRILEAERKLGKKIVMCSGTFDLLHLGHMNLMKSAKSNGDILIVAVKTDRAASLKKEDPPVLNQEMRMQMIENCIFADYIISVDFNPLRTVNFDFKNESSYQWLNMFLPAIASIQPHIFVHENNPVLADARVQLFHRYNVESVIQPRMNGISTSDIIDKITTRLLLKMNNNQTKY